MLKFGNRSRALNTWLRVVLSGLLWILLAGCVVSIPVTGSGDQTASSSLFTRSSFNYLGQKVEYDIYVPPDYRQGRPLPLVISIQDPGSTSEQQEKVTGLTKGAGSTGYLIAYLYSMEGVDHWRYGLSGGPADDLDLFAAWLRHLSIAWDVVPGRLYLVGMGQGAEFAYVLGCTFANQVTAVALVSGRYPVNMNCQPSMPVSVLMIHGTQDQEMPFEAVSPYQPVRDAARTWAGWNGCESQAASIYTDGNAQADGWSGCQAGTEVVLFSITGGKHTWPGTDLNATELIWQFFLTHTR